MTALTTSLAAAAAVRVPVTTPVLYGGSASYIAATRENVTFKQTTPSWDKFTIVGPGAINGHVGWVNASGDGTVNTGYYAGLEANHGYTVTYQPYTGINGQPVTGSRDGYVYFITNQPQASPTSSPSLACHPLTDGGKCYSPGEYCSNADHDTLGVAGNGASIKCEDSDGWRWEDIVT